MVGVLKDVLAKRKRCLHDALTMKSNGCVTRGSTYLCTEDTGAQGKKRATGCLGITDEPNIVKESVFVQVP